MKGIRKTMSKLTGKVAVVTGASKGIGASIAEHLAAEGASVVVNYATQQVRRREVVRHITEKGGKAIAAQADVSKPQDITRLFAETKAAYGKVDILVNNAGVYEFAPLEAVNAEPLPQAVRSQCARPASHHAGGRQTHERRRRLDHQHQFLAGPMPFPTASVYSATKAAVDAITVSLSKELGPRKIRVNSLNPGMVETEGVHAAGIFESDFRKTIEAQTPLGRIAQPEDIARAAVFFSSDDAGWVTGQTLLLAGGQRQ